MRVGLIGDVHGNLLALDAVLSDLRREHVDTIICLGDVVLGPQPRETLARIRSMGCRVVMGNWDAYGLDGFPELDDELGRRFVEIGAWWAGQLTREDRRYMRTFEPLVELTAPGGATLVAFHGSPRSFEDSIFAETPEEELDRMLDGCRGEVLVAGHTHFQLVRRHGEAVVVNPGSVGLVFRRREGLMRIAPWAEYGIVRLEGDRLGGVELRRTPYDVDALVRLLLDSEMPHAAWWARLWGSEPLAATHAEAAARPN